MSRRSKTTRVATQKDAAIALGCHVRSLRDWEKAAWFPANGRTAKGWDVEAIKAARDAAGLEATDNRNAELTVDRANAAAVREGRRQLDSIRAQILEIRNGLASKTLIVRFDAQSVVADVLSGISAELEQMPGLIGRFCCQECRPRFERELANSFRRQQEAGPARLEKCMKEWDAANGYKGAEPLQPITMPSDAAMAERLKVLLGRRELQWRKLVELEAYAFPTAGHWVLKDEILAIIRDIIDQCPDEGLAMVKACCHVATRNELNRSLAQTLATAEKLFEGFEQRQGIMRQALNDTSPSCRVTRNQAECAE